MTRYDYTFKISILASKDVGKKTLAKRFPNFNEVSYSVEKEKGVHFLYKTLEFYDKVAKLQLWILFPESKFFIESYLHGSIGIIIMYDITNLESLNRISEWMRLIRNKLDYDTPIFLVGNKLDLEKNREVSKEQIEMLENKYNVMSSVEISLKTGENVEEMFMSIAKLIYNRRIQNQD